MQKQCRVFGILRYILASQSMVIMPMRCDFNGTKASADSEERSVSVVQDKKTRRSFAKVKCTATMNAFVKRWQWDCQVEWRVWNIRRMTRKRRGRDMKL